MSLKVPTDVLNKTMAAMRQAAPVVVAANPPTNLWFTRKTRTTNRHSCNEAITKHVHHRNTLLPSCALTALYFYQNTLKSFKKASSSSRVTSFGSACLLACLRSLSDRLQDRRGQDETVGTSIPEDIPRTPLWRGMTACQELEAAGVPVCALIDPLSA
eukprot:3084722-Amphidinium_carterae.2